MGSTVFHEIMNDIKYNPKLKVDLSSIKPGIYLASLTDANYKTITKRIIKSDLLNNDGAFGKPFNPKQIVEIKEDDLIIDSSEDIIILK